VSSPSDRGCRPVIDDHDVSASSRRPCERGLLTTPSCSVMATMPTSIAGRHWKRRSRRSRKRIARRLRNNGPESTRNAPTEQPMAEIERHEDEGAKAFDPHLARRLLSYVRPYRLRATVSWGWWFCRRYWRSPHRPSWPSPSISI